MVQIMFETFNVTGLYAVEQAVLSLYSVGRISGCAVDVGHGKTGTILVTFTCNIILFILSFMYKTIVLDGIIIDARSSTSTYFAN